MELCAGEGVVSSSLRWAGVPTASLDIDYWNEIEEREAAANFRVRNNPLDLLTDAGMATLGFLNHAWLGTCVISTPQPLKSCEAQVVLEHHPEAPHRQLLACSRHGLQQLGGNQPFEYKATLFHATW